MTVEIKEEERRTLAERLRERYGDDIADRILAPGWMDDAVREVRDSSSTARARFDDAAMTRTEALPRQEIVKQVAAARWKSRRENEATREKTPLPSCPTCEPEKSQVVPWTGDGVGNVTTWHCISCQSYWEVS